MKYSKYTYEQFLNELKLRLEKHFGDDYDVVLDKIFKNNGSIVWSFIIYEKGPVKYPKASPVINVEDIYNAYLSGESINSIIEKIDYIYGVFSENKIDICNVNADNVQQCIFYRLVNYEKNKELLEELPHIRFLDLALTFHYLYNADTDMMQSLRITNKIMEQWQLEIEQLIEIAEKNTPELFPDKIDTIKNVIESLMDKKLEDVLSEDELAERREMYVLTNEKSINGATAIFYSDKIKELAELYQQDIVILPSSIHEVLLLPIESEEETGMLQSLVESINKEHVAKEEVLSDTVYIYDRQKGEIDILQT
ncbi:MAG: hypothetical protein E7267_03545 [Lachnospiraceae bacterium]|nr:hypothetical protein [Lachnospiraceae bacterium]